MMKRTGETQNGTELFEPYRYSNGKYRVEVEVSDISDLEAIVKAGCIDTRVVRGVRMKGNMGSGPSVVPITDITF